MAIGDVRIELGGAERVFRFRLGAWAALEDKGYTLEQVMEQFKTGQVSFKALQVLLWAMLKHEKPAPSMEDIGEWVGLDNFQEVINKLGEAWKDATPDPPRSAEPMMAGVGPASSNTPADLD